ncbi:DUF5675 family protein [Lutibacter aestuarii]|uniref:DUF5675 family protein n=1 Tax=Lutibacter aestuarii TaxID=861111 RepID=A0ABW2ZB48_9FLAO
MGKPVVEIIRRNQNETQTLGTCTVLIDNDIPMFTSLSLERGWRNNIKNVSCIPIGIYNLELEYSPKFNKLLWEIKGVPNRSETKFHIANYWKQLNGCISLGTDPMDINKDNYLDVTNSEATIKKFHKALNDYTKAILIIKGKIGIN